MKAIKLNENYRIEKDSYSWVLIFNEKRQKKSKDSGEMVDYIFEDFWYYPCIKQLLNRFIQLNLKESESIQDLSDKMDILTSKVEELKNTIFNK